MPSNENQGIDAADPQEDRAALQAEYGDAVQADSPSYVQEPAPETVPGSAVEAGDAGDNLEQCRPTATNEDAKQWYEDAKKQTPETLAAFLSHVNDDYEHTYDSAVWAVAAGALAGAWAMNKQDQMGITGFQAGGVMWTFVREWLHIEGPVGMIKYNDMLFPQNDYKFKTITKSMFEELQRIAAAKIAEVESPAEGTERASSPHPNVMAHWKGIVAGNVPFGYTVRD